MTRLLAVVGADEAETVVAAVPDCSTVVEGALAAVLVEPAAAADVADMLRDAELVAAMVPVCSALLPARAGQEVTDAAAARALLHERADELDVALQRVRGSVELGVRATARDDVPAAVQDGRAYLAARVRAWSWVGPFVAALEELRTTPGVRDVAVLAQTPQVVKGSLLVDATAAAGLRVHVATHLARPDVELVCSGPFAPYSFVGPPQGVPA